MGFRLAAALPFVVGYNSKPAFCIRRCGFAKLTGDGLEYYVRKYEITLGRASKSESVRLCKPRRDLNMRGEHGCGYPEREVGLNASQYERSCACVSRLQAGKQTSSLETT